MKNFQLVALITIGCLFSCTQNAKQNTSDKKDTVAKSATAIITSQKNAPVDTLAEKNKIQNLISLVLKGGKWKADLDLIPILLNPKDSLYYGFDLQKLKQNLVVLKNSNLFSAGFIENYNQIILTLDKKMRNGQYQKFGTGELPSFPFDNDVDIWCDCQDVPYDEPNAYDYITVQIIKLDNNSGQLNWLWGNLPEHTDKSWREFKYRFDVVKEDNLWKISYLQGFDFKDATR